MRIGVDARMLSCSGIGKVIENILIRLIPSCNDWEFVLLVTSDDYGKYSFFTHKNVRCIECNAPIYSIREQLEMFLKIPRNLDVFWSPHYNIPLFYNKKLVVTVHDLAHLALNQGSNDFIKKLYAGFMLKCVTKKATKIVCVSKFTISELVRFFPKVNLKKVELVYNGVDESWFNIKEGRPLRKEPYYVYVGNVKPHKNLVRLIEAYKMICKDIPQDLVIIGKKDGFINGVNNISALIDGYEDRIIFTGYVDDVTLQQYVVQSDGMIFPSLYEGFGLPPVESVVAGVPVLVSDIPVMHELFGDDVMYFYPKDTKEISRKIKDWHKKNIKNIKINKFSWALTCRLMKKILYKTVKIEVCNE